MKSPGHLGQWSDDGSLTLVSYKKKTHVTRANNDGQEVSLLHFKHFQGKIYNVVQGLVAANSKHPFIIKWGQLVKDN